MFTGVTHSSIFVLDQDEALDFYVGKLGMEVVQDVSMEVMRWVTICVPGQPEREILLETPENPFIEPEAAEMIRELLSKGMIGLGFILATDDCRRTYAELIAKGVESVQEPTDRFYGTDCAIRDPFGNHIRITEPAEGPLEPPERSSGSETATA